MKKKLQYALFICLTSMAGLYTSGCNKKTEDPAPSADNTVTGTLMFHMHTYIDTTEVDEYNIVYKTALGRKISLSMAQLYLSNIELKKPDGTYYLIPDSLVLQEQDLETYMVANVPAGNYTGVRYHVGLDPATSVKAPSIGTVLNKPAMWFNNTSAQPDGYVYVNIQGKIDTSAAANGSDASMVPFNYLIGTSANYKEVTMPAKNFSVTPTVPGLVHILTDYNKIFNGIDLKDVNNLSLLTPTDNASPLGTKLGNNTSILFGYEE
jgi:hypothetical protein